MKNKKQKFFKIVNKVENLTNVVVIYLIIMIKTNIIVGFRKVFK
jgi:hypothetical protein